MGARVVPRQSSFRRFCRLHLTVERKPRQRRTQFWRGSGLIEIRAPRRTGGKALNSTLIRLGCDFHGSEIEHPTSGAQRLQFRSNSFTVFRLAAPLRQTALLVLNVPVHSSGGPYKVFTDPIHLAGKPACRTGAGAFAGFAVLVSEQLTGTRTTAEHRFHSTTKYSPGRSPAFSFIRFSLTYSFPYPAAFIFPRHREE